MSSPEPPPVDRSGNSPRRRLQFNTAMLLGMLTLVAVLCALAMTVPWLLAMLIGFAFDVVFVGYGVVLAIGAWMCPDHRRVFCVGALVGLALAVWGGFGLISGWNHLSRSSSWTSWYIAAPALLRQVEQIALSLFGGWVALRTADFWESKAPDSNA